MIRKIRYKLKIKIFIIMSAYTRKLYNQIVIIWKEHDTNNMCMCAICKYVGHECNLQNNIPFLEGI